MNFEGVNVLKFLILGLFGATGVLLRYGLMQVIPHTQFPWAVLAANVSGSFAAGVLFSLYFGSGESSGATVNLILIGLLGGFTTYSSYSLDTVRLMASSAWLMVFLNIAMNNLLSIGACFFGLKIAERF